MYLWLIVLKPGVLKPSVNSRTSVNRGAEITFEWNEREYHICPVWPNGEVKYCITPLDTQQDTVYKNADDMLEYIIDDTRLRDIITKVEVTDRTL